MHQDAALEALRYRIRWLENDSYWWRDHPAEQMESIAECELALRILTATFDKGEEKP